MSVLLVADVRVNVYAYSPQGASIYGGGASERALAGSEGSYVAGGMDFDPADPRTCSELRADGQRCQAFAVNGGTLCIGHRNRAEKKATSEEAE